MTILRTRAGDPVPSTIQIGEPLPLVAVPTYEDGTAGPATTDARWTIEPAYNGSIDKGVLVVDVPGPVTVTATLEDVTSDPATLTAGQPLAPLTVTAAPRDGGQTLAVSPDTDPANTRRVRITDRPEPVAYGQQCGDWDYLTDGLVRGREGQVANVVDVSQSGSYARAYGSVVLPAPTDRTGLVYHGAADTDTPDVSKLASESKEGAAGTYEFTPDPTGQHLVFALPATWPTPTFTVSGFAAPFAKTGTVTIGNIDYDVWASKHRMTRPTTVVIQ